MDIHGLYLFFAIGFDEFKATFEFLVGFFERGFRVNVLKTGEIHECEQQIASAEHSVHIEKLRAAAVETDIQIASAAIAQLHQTGVLDAYLKRRRDEATSLSKTLYLNIN